MIMHVVKTYRKPVETILIKLRSFRKPSGKVVGLLFTLLVLASIPVTTTLVQQNQNIGEKAAASNQCSDGEDNDMDGSIDFTSSNPDSECSSIDDAYETPDCLGISISPEKTVYKPGDVVNIIVNTEGSAMDIKVYWDQATRNLIREKITDFKGSPITEIEGNYDNSLKSWSGSFTIPKNGEYIIYPRIYSTEQSYCTGNPGFTCSDCKTGAVDNADQAFTPSYPCQGCYKTIAVDSYADYTQGPDLATYWNLQPGNSYLYQGVNRHKDENQSTLWHALNTIENKVQVCGLTLTPWRMTKDSDLAYNWPNSDRIRRIFMSAFEEGQPWLSSSLGKPLAHDYHRNPNDGTYGLGTIGTEFPPDEKTNSAPLERSTSINLNNLNTQPIPIEFRYFSPHYFTKRYVPDGWSFDWVEHLQSDSSNPFTNCDWSYNATGHERYIKNAVFYVDSIPTGLGDPSPSSAISSPTSIQSPAYSGPGIVVKLLECGSENCKEPGTWMTREDWYLAPGIGRVRLDQKPINDPAIRQECASKDINDKHPCFGDMYSASPMSNPALSMEVISYYNGGKLNVQVVNSDIATNGKLELNVKTPQGLPYTGWLESKSCVSDTTCTPNLQFKWTGWVQNGYGFVDYVNITPAIQPGTRHSYFRPWVESAPSPGETLLAKPELEWSDEVVFKVSDSSTIPTTQNLPCATGFSFTCTAINQTTSTAKIDWNDLTGAEKYIVRVNKEPFDEWLNPTFDIWAWANSSEYKFTAENGKMYKYDVQGVKPGEKESFGGERCPFEEKSCPAPSSVQIVLNEATNKTCNEICSGLGKTCISVGTNAAANNNLFSANRLICTNIRADCSSRMTPKNKVCGFRTFWTRCGCQ